VKTVNFAGVDLPKTAKRAKRSRPAVDSAPETLRDKVLELKREEILRVASELFFTKGFTQASIDEIAARLSIGKPQIYACFVSKTALLTEVCTRTAALAAELAAESLRTNGSPTERLSHIVRGLCRCVIEGRMSMAVLFREIKHLPDDAVAELAGNFHLFNKCLGDLLREGAAAGEFSIPDPAVLTLAISGMTTWIYSWYRPEGSHTADEIADQMAFLALRMVGSSPHPCVRLATPAKV
jgi:AcrR family transcriptional regulator